MNKVSKQLASCLFSLALALSFSLTTEAVSVNDFPADNGVDYSELFSRENIHDLGYRSFNSLIEVQPDANVIITEVLTVDFTNATSRHGMIRYIPMKYLDKYGNYLNLRFKLLSVTDTNDQPYPYEYNFEDPNAMIKLGSADQYVDGQIVTYKIKYQVSRVINRFDSYDELFWNTTGNGNDSAIANSTTIITLPKGVSSENLKTKCFTGYEGSTEQDCTIDIMDDQTVRYTLNNPLDSYGGISVVIGFPKDLLTFPSALTTFLWFLEDNWGFGLPIICLAFMLWQWNVKGRDPEPTKSTVMAEYEVPDNLRPAEVGTLIDDNLDTRDITSTIIDLATRGWLKIIENKEKGFFGENFSYTLEKTIPKDKNDTLLDYEQQVYNGLFSSGDTVKLDELKYKFYKIIPDIQKSVYSRLVSQKYYASDPDKARGTYFGLAAGLFFGTIFMMEFVIMFMPSLVPGLLISAVIIFCFGFIMPKKTQKGVDIKVRILGLEEFLRTAERDRMKFYEKENIFEQMLPYAIAFNLGEKWAKACEGLSQGAPDWYQSSDPSFRSNFNSYMLLHTMNNFNNSLSTSMTTAPRSSASSGSSGFSGGGFSGGGFGGGGSSSW
ncbi:DUF2207 domain-containing protein [Candidatus Peregrinibacteria bacterium]|nr:DUF2207 domain-containing protein [Candidatus Peregrinibacteria bacterium]